VNMLETSLKLKGDVEMIIDYADGRRETRCFRNTVLNNGKEVLAKTLAGDIGTSFMFFICKMVFGNNGTIGEVPRFVDAGRDGLFGPAVISKNVIANIDVSSPTQVIFTAILTFDDAVGYSLSEMALQLADESFYSIVTFGDITKTAQMQITWNWRLSFI
jgi:hypothetical protein